MTVDLERAEWELAQVRAELARRFDATAQCRDEAPLHDTLWIAWDAAHTEVRSALAWFDGITGERFVPAEVAP